MDIPGTYIPRSRPANHLAQVFRMRESTCETFDKLSVITNKMSFPEFPTTAFR